MAKPTSPAKRRGSRACRKLPVFLGAVILVFLLAQLWTKEAPESTNAVRVVLATPPSSKPPTTGFSHLNLTLQHVPTSGHQFPKIIIQTVRNKSRIPCENLDSINSWRVSNPGYRHMLFDNQDILRFMHTHHPEWLDTFRALNTSVERTDMWRYLALYTYGGVYADSDVRCMKPIDEWNAENNHDARVLVGLEGTDENWHRGSQFQQWTIAAVVNHTLLGSMARYIATFLREHPYHDVDVPTAMALILKRTGPGRWTDAVLDYMQAAAEEDGALPSHESMRNGVRVGDIRIMPVVNMALGWGQTCDKVAEEHAAYLCHQFHGSWKKDYRFRKELRDDCKTPDELLVDVAV